MVKFEYTFEELLQGQSDRTQEAKRPIEEKMRDVVRMQWIGYEIARSKGHVTQAPWLSKELEEEFNEYS